MNTLCIVKLAFKNTLLLKMQYFLNIFSNWRLLIYRKDDTNEFYLFYNWTTLINLIIWPIGFSFDSFGFFRQISKSSGHVFPLDAV